eukprot:6385113-Pyramimonas_sp.AAC.1
MASARYKFRTCHNYCVRVLTVGERTAIAIEHFHLPSICTQLWYLIRSTSRIRQRRSGHES